MSVPSISARQLWAEMSELGDSRLECRELRDGKKLRDGGSSAAICGDRAQQLQAGTVEFGGPRMAGTQGDQQFRSRRRELSGSKRM